VRKAADHRAADPDSDPHHHIPSDAKHLVEEHQPPGEAENEPDQRPDQPGRHGRGLTPSAARGGARPAATGANTAAPGSDLDRLRQD
jgi:hypothetical protein